MGTGCQREREIRRLIDGPVEAGPRGEERKRLNARAGRKIMLAEGLEKRKVADRVGAGIQRGRKRKTAENWRDLAKQIEGAERVGCRQGLNQS